MKRFTYNLVMGVCVFVMACCLVMGAVVIKASGLTSPVQVYAAAKSGADDYIMSIRYSFDKGELMSTLPKYISEFMEADGWQIVRTGSSRIQSGAVGLTVPDERTIYLSSNDVSAYYAFYHEIGHVIDYRFNWISHSDEFEALYQKEAVNYADANYHQIKGHASEDGFEFFASVCCDIFLGNEENLKSVPDTVEYIINKTQIKRL